MAKFEILKRTNGEFHFNLKSGNGKIILTSESYKKKDSCKNGIESVKKNSSVENRYEIKDSKDGKSYFVLKANNGQVIGVSETYESQASVKKGMESVKKNAASAKVKDMSEMK